MEPVDGRAKENTVAIAAMAALAKADASTSAEHCSYKTELRLGLWFLSRPMVSAPSSTTTWRCTIASQRMSSVIAACLSPIITGRFDSTKARHLPRVYSFYTPSRQAGLLLADVDGDGLTDIFAGNYWIRSPNVRPALAPVCHQHAP